MADYHRPAVARPERARLLELAKLFLVVGATGFGGGSVMLVMIHAEAVEKRLWLTQAEFDEALTLAQILPGPVAGSVAVYVGYRLRGWVGALVSAFCYVAPSFLLMLLFTIGYLNYGNLPQLPSAFRGLGTAVAAVIIAGAWRMSRSARKDRRSSALLVGSALAILLFRTNAVLLIVLAGLAGLAIFRGAPEVRSGRAKGSGE